MVKTSIEVHAESFCGSDTYFSSERGNQHMVGGLAAQAGESEDRRGEDLGSSDLIDDGVVEGTDKQV